MWWVSMCKPYLFILSNVIEKASIYCKCYSLVQCATDQTEPIVNEHHPWEFRNVIFAKNEQWAIRFILFCYLGEPLIYICTYDLFVCTMMYVYIYARHCTVVYNVHYCVLRGVWKHRTRILIWLWKKSMNNLHLFTCVMNYWNTTAIFLTDDTKWTLFSSLLQLLCLKHIARIEW